MVIKRYPPPSSVDSQQLADHFLAVYQGSLILAKARHTIDLKAYQGQKVMISFYRFASCPFCNLRVKRILDQYTKFEERGLRMISFWQSPRATILEHVGQHAMPFPMIPDPIKNYYVLYGVENSWAGAFKVMRDPKLIVQAMKGGFNPTTADGDMNQLPADFLLNPDLTVHTAYYGNHIGDHIGFTEIERFIGIDMEARPN